MNEKLSQLGWAAVGVRGFIPPAVFTELQALGVLAIAADIRTHEHIEYTPAPDIVHESAGHAPIIANARYAEYLKRCGLVGFKAIATVEDQAVFEAIRNLSVVKEDPTATRGGGGPRPGAPGGRQREPPLRQREHPRLAALLVDGGVRAHRQPGAPAPLRRRPAVQHRRGEALPHRRGEEAAAERRRARTPSTTSPGCSRSSSWRATSSTSSRCWRSSRPRWRGSAAGTTA